MRQAEAAFAGIDLSDAALARRRIDRLADPDEMALIKTLAGWPRLLESAAEAGEPHRVAFYLYDLASPFHALWTRGKDDAALRFVLPEDRELTLARLALVRGVGVVVASGLRLIGVEAGRGDALMLPDPQRPLSTPHRRGGALRTGHASSIALVAVTRLRRR